MMSELGVVVIFLSGCLSMKSVLSVWNTLWVLVLWMYLVVKGASLSESMKLMSEWSFMDTLSAALIILSIYLTILMSVASNMIICFKKFETSFLALMGMLLLALYMSFISSNYLMFYFMFEASLLPTLYIIMGWGYQPERLQAGVYFMVYTLFVSLPLFMNLIYLESGFVSKVMWDSLFTSGGATSGLVKDYVFVLFMLLAFLVKLPMYSAHLWLPSAHVEAPVAGSMILAGVLLKLGGYGLMRVSLKMQFLMGKVSAAMVSLSILGMVYVGAMCCRLNDMKSLVAYSSVAHMGFVISGLFSGFTWGVNGAVVLMVSHGLGSSGLFSFVNLVYERTSSRSVYLNSGGLTFIPMLSFFMFMLCCANFSAPPSVNFLSEVMLMISLMGFEKSLMMVFPIGSFLGVIFTLYLYSYSQHGKIYGNMSGLVGGNTVDYHVMVLHVLPINVLVFKSDLFYLG